MATKAQIKAKFQETYTGNPDLTDWEEVEETLHTAAASILENIYPTPIRDQSSGTKTVTESNANFSYGVTITKTGRKVNMNGSFTALSNRPAFSPIFDVILAEFTSDFQVYYATAKKVGADTILISMSSADTLIIRQSILLGETFYFDITYNTSD